MASLARSDVGIEKIVTDQVVFVSVVVIVIVVIVEVVFHNSCSCTVDSM